MSGGRRQEEGEGEEGEGEGGERREEREEVMILCHKMFMAHIPSVWRRSLGSRSRRPCVWRETLLTERKSETHELQYWLPFTLPGNKVDFTNLQHQPMNTSHCACYTHAQVVMQCSGNA